MLRRGAKEIAARDGRAAQLLVARAIDGLGMIHGGDQTMRYDDVEPVRLTVPVLVDGSEQNITRPLPWRLDLAYHSPTGLSWGYGGSGPNQLALAILAALSDDATALQLYHQFCTDWIAPLPHPGRWGMHFREIRTWIEEHRLQPTVDAGNEPI